MKCVCGYDSNDSNDSEPFHELSGTSSIRVDFGMHTVKLYACPECGTVRMVRDIDTLTQET